MKNKDNNNDIEEMLLSNTSLDELIKKKIEREFVTELEQAKRPKEKKHITDITKAPKNLIYSRQSVFKVFNRINKSETYINGVQAEALTGTQNSIHDKLQNGEISTFVTKDAYIKFEYVEFYE